jgi:carboxylate-amine ligase
MPSDPRPGTGRPCTSDAPIEFCGSPAATLGVELELGLVDRRTRQLTAASNEVLAELAGMDAVGAANLEEKVKHELFQCTLEVITGICDTVDDAISDLSGSLAQVRCVTDRMGLDLVGSATHPFSDWSDQVVSPHERYSQLVESIQWPARRLAIHGVHFHVGVPSGEHAIAVVRSLAYHLPLFLALTASSPYWLGRDTGLASSRTKIFEGLPTAGLPPPLADWAEFEQLMGGMLRGGIISSIREIWWDCRPHPDFGTVELRMCDGIATMDEVAAVAALAQSLVAELVERVDAGEPLPGAPEWVVRENKWLAARFGADDSLLVDGDGTRRPVVELVGELVDRLGPTASTLGCRGSLDQVPAMLERGGSYRRQRQVIAEGGTMSDLVDSLAREHRVGLA